eukprot:Skav216288  [mRNA]  locus=scaffold494:23187:29029:- [translate_table: standard]
MSLQCLYGSDERPRKKSKVTVPVDEGLGGLYDFLPPPDPEKDEAAKAAAVKNHLSRPALPPLDKSRVIFLDVDGVILPAGSIDMIVVDGVTLPAKSHVKESDFSAQAMGSLRAIVQQTGATIVLSSEWRQGTLCNTESLHDLSNPLDGFEWRGEDLKSSINAVLKSQEGSQDHPEVVAWVALDDLDFDWADALRQAGRIHQGTVAMGRYCSCGARKIWKWHEVRNEVRNEVEASKDSWLMLVA